MTGSVTNPTTHLSPISGVINQLETIFEASAELINSFGGLILVGVTLLSIVHTIQYLLTELISRVTPKFWLGKDACTLDNIRLRLGSGIIFALELLVAADVIDTLTKPVQHFKLETLYKIGMVVAIRKFLF